MDQRAFKQDGRDERRGAFVLCVLSSGPTHGNHREHSRGHSRENHCVNARGDSGLNESAHSDQNHRGDFLVPTNQIAG